MKIAKKQIPEKDKIRKEKVDLVLNVLSWDLVGSGKYSEFFRDSNRRFFYCNGTVIKVGYDEDLEKINLEAISQYKIKSNIFLFGIGRKIGYVLNYMEDLGNYLRKNMLNSYKDSNKSFNFSELEEKVESYVIQTCGGEGGTNSLWESSIGSKAQVRKDLISQ